VYVCPSLCFCLSMYVCLFRPCPPPTPTPSLTHSLTHPPTHIRTLKSSSAMDTCKKGEKKVDEWVPPHMSLFLSLSLYVYVPLHALPHAHSLSHTRTHPQCVCATRRLGSLSSKETSKQQKENRKKEEGKRKKEKEKRCRVFASSRAI